MIDLLGNLYTPDAIFLEGKWYKDRVADLLLFNDQPENIEAK